MTWSIAELLVALRRPVPFQISDAPFWSDDYIARQLLIAHLDQSDDAASRPFTELDRCVAALANLGLIDSGRRVLDLGCGPGLIAERLAASGAAVTGIDSSAWSLRYARESAGRRGLSIDYRQQDFRELADVSAYDLVLQSYGEFGTFDEATLSSVLAATRRALQPGGVLVFDVTTPSAAAPQPANDWRLARGGLWRPGEYVLLTDHLDYPGHVRCDRYVVLDDAVTTYRLWKQAYDPVAITAILTRAGFVVDHLWSTLAGEPYQEGSPWLAVVARKSVRRVCGLYRCEHAHDVGDSVPVSRRHLGSRPRPPQLLPGGVMRTRPATSRNEHAMLPSLQTHGPAGSRARDPTAVQGRSCR